MGYGDCCSPRAAARRIRGSANGYADGIQARVTHSFRGSEIDSVRSSPESPVNGDSGGVKDPGRRSSDRDVYLNSDSSLGTRNKSVAGADCATRFETIRVIVD